ncbi:MAG: alpha/beta hydrolase [Promethearchaeota archaeon]|nr:MAG: alpha/beta hydrolase [Candidatus Lokiarchaeota archaeon]
MSDSTERFAYVNGIKICYQIYGNEDDFPLICVHGFGSKKETWIAQVGDLSKKFKVITFDLRSAGKSDRPEKPYGMDVLAEDISELMEFLNINKAHFMGFSLGGMIVQHFVLTHPEKVDKLILICTSAGIPHEGGIEMFRKNQLERIELIKKDPEKVFWQDALRGFHWKFRKQMEANPKKKFYDCWSAEDLIKYIKNNPSTSQDVENQAYCVKTHNTYDRLHEIQHKTLLIAASHDRLVSKTSLIEIHKRIPNSIYKEIDKAGHEVHRSRAPEVNTLILDFLLN